MLLSWLSKFVASILVSLLCLAVITSIFSSTLLSSHYIEGQLTKTDSYSKLSAAIISQVAKDNNKSGDNSDPNLPTQLKSVVTPAYVQSKINSGLDQFQAYYKGTGPAPTIDLSDFITRAQAAGIPIKSNGDSGFSKPLTLKNASQVEGVGKLYNRVEFDAVVASAVLLIFLIALSWERHRFAAAPDVLIIVGVLMGLLSLFFSLAPGMAVHYLKIDFSSNAFAPIGRDLATSVAHNLGVRFGIIAGLSLVIGIATRVYIAKRKLSGDNVRQKFLKDFGGKPKTAPSKKK